MIRTNSLQSQDSKQKWLCSACTFKNHPGVLSCQICNTHKEGIPGDDHAVGRNDPFGFKCHNCKFELQKLVSICPKCKEVLIPQEGSEEQEQISKKSQKALKDEKEITKMKGCPSCGEMNDVLNDECVFCEENFEIKEQPLIPIKKRARKPKAPRSYGRGYPRYPMVGYASCKYCHIQCLADQIEDHQEGCVGQSNEDLQTKYLLVSKVSCHFCYKKTKPEEHMEHQKDCSQRKNFFDSQSSTFKRCTKLQIDTMFYMHQKSQKKHWIMEKALIKRIQKLGYKAEQLQNLHHYIVNYAPIIIHMHASRHMQFFVKDTHYRNQFETHKSSGSLSSSSRISWEDRMFDRKHHSATPFERVKYGTINFTNDPKGVRACVSYGNSYFLLKPHVRNRCTVTDMDSSSSTATIATFQFSYHLLMKLSDAQLKAAFDGSKANEVESTMIGAYKEIQIHGPVQFKQDIERVYINKNQIGDPKILDMVKEFCKNNQLKYQLFGEEVPKVVAGGVGVAAGLGGGFGFGGGFGGGFGAGFGGGGLLPPAPLHRSPFSFGSYPSYPARGAGGSLFGSPAVLAPPKKDPQEGIDYI